MTTLEPDPQDYGQPAGSWEPGLWQTVGSDSDGTSQGSPSPLNPESERCPLSLRIQPFMAEEPRPPGYWVEATALWRTMMSLMKPDQRCPRSDHFTASLSAAQNLSWSLLKDWWDGGYQEPSLSAAVRAFVDAGGNLPLSHLRLEDCKYQAAMFCLFHAELHPDSVSTGTLRGLDTNRDMALDHSTAQKIAYGICNRSSGQISARGALAYANEHRDNACPWLAEAPSSDRNLAEVLPYYLWDVARRRTIVVSDHLRDTTVPQYTCVSHTWGRWKKDTLPVQVEGVQDWKIPENEIFDVQKLPQLLAEAQLTTPFVWFDLLCIPQDTSNPRYLEEISRQGTIFRGSAACIAWLDDIEDWGGLQRTAKFLGLNYVHLGAPSDIYQTDQMLLEATAAANVPPDLIREDGQLSPWFTSLWTLQEACLCPEVVLCNLKFEPFSVCGNIITLGQLMRLHDVNINMIEEVEARSGTLVGIGDWPLGPLLMQYIKFFVGGDSGVHNRQQVLALGHLRQCSERRVEAIMSVMDVTDWFTEHLHRHGTRPDEGNLVLDAYPLQFVNEAARKIGAIFYDSLGALRPGGVESQDYGSMLPFSKPRSGNITINSLKVNPGFRRDCYDDVTDHEAVSRWEILESGSVIIREAGILSSSDEPRGVGDARLFIINRAVPPSPIAQFHAGLDSWLGQVAEGRIRIAVSLCKIVDVNTGIFLEGAKKSGMLDLVKIGSYDIRGDLELPDVQEVLWKVR